MDVDGRVGPEHSRFTNVRDDSVGRRGSYRRLQSLFDRVRSRAGKHPGRLADRYIELEATRAVAPGVTTGAEAAGPEPGRHAVGNARARERRYLVGREQRAR